MPIPLLPAYPSEQDIRYGLWLKHFATQLPTYADRYNLSVLQLLEVQCIAKEYLDLLIWRLQHTTASIVRRQQPPALTPVAAQALVREAETSQEQARSIQGSIDKVVVYMQQHPIYTTRDGHALQLSAASPRVA